MYLTLPILLFLITSTTLALPTTSNPTLPTFPHNTTTPSLHKRTKASWLGSFPNAACSGPVGPNVVHDTQMNVCIKFTPTPGMAWVGVNYGSGDDHVSDVSFFVDDGCKYILGGSSNTGYVEQSNTAKGMRCSKDLGSAKSFKVEGKMQSII